MPLGMASAGPVANAIGVQPTLWAAFAIALVCQVATALVPSVRAIRAPETESPEPAGA